MLILPEQAPSWKATRRQRKKRLSAGKTEGSWGEAAWRWIGSFLGNYFVVPAVTALTCFVVTSPGLPEYLIKNRKQDEQR